MEGNYLGLFDLNALARAQSRPASHFPNNTPLVRSCEGNADLVRTKARRSAPRVQALIGGC
jgi:hypothetical protein